MDLFLVRFEVSMEQLLASRSVSITELKRSPSAVLDQAGDEPVAVLNHNRPAAYLLSPEVYAAMLSRLHNDLRTAIDEGAASGPSISADTVYAELSARYADELSPPAQVKIPGKRTG